MKVHKEIEEYLKYAAEEMNKAHKDKHSGNSEKSAAGEARVGFLAGLVAGLNFALDRMPEGVDPILVFDRAGELSRHLAQLVRTIEEKTGKPLPDFTDAQKIPEFIDDVVKRSIDKGVMTQKDADEFKEMMDSFKELNSEFFGMKDGSIVQPGYKGAIKSIMDKRKNRKNSSPDEDEDDSETMDFDKAFKAYTDKQNECSEKEEEKEVRRHPLYATLKKRFKI